MRGKLEIKDQVPNCQLADAVGSVVFTVSTWVFRSRLEVSRKLLSVHWRLLCWFSFRSSRLFSCWAC